MEREHQHMSELILTSAYIAEATGGTMLCGNPHAPARGICTDTRSILPGQAFFALVGANHDGHDYVPLAVASGAPVLVVERAPKDPEQLGGAAIVLVPNTERALLALGARRRTWLDGQVAAVTGSYGKSTVKDMLGDIMKRNGQCTVAPDSYNNRIGVGLTLLSASRDDDSGVLEMGTNHPGEIAELAEAVRPDLGVITSIGEVHLEGLGSLDGVREAKAELIPHVQPDGVLVLNADDPLCASLGERYDGQVRTFGLTADADVRPERIHADADGWRFDIRGWSYRVPSRGRHNVLNAAAAVCAATAMGASLRSALLALAEFRPQALRYEHVELGGVTFVCDCYNSNPPAMRAALKSFLLEKTPGRKIVVCGDMLELGDEAPRLHRELGMDLAASRADMLVAVGQHAPQVIDGWHRKSLASQNALLFANAEHAWSPLWWELQPGDAVLLKGSRAAKLETITERIAEHLREEGKEAAA